MELLGDNIGVGEVLELVLDGVLDRVLNKVLEAIVWVVIEVEIDVEVVDLIEVEELVLGGGAVVERGVLWGVVVGVMEAIVDVGEEPSTLTVDITNFVVDATVTVAMMSLVTVRSTVATGEVYVEVGDPPSTGTTDHLFCLMANPLWFCAWNGRESTVDDKRRVTRCIEVNMMGCSMRVEFGMIVNSSVYVDFC
jgi:hypothetical protein